ncbi:hypothetical protein GCM10010218_20070 [Streptomyces mashuensis]|uniref:Uncharacterized protein n=1 Tax=Streptomyces mashuensis TaxID=33904 RepID=A0A919B0P6_9ACTN|nr:hypothetical protein [Streptomyces mashuensis]GHF38816.1 hypothetical protein GCM10010218_20070 [Streptomyces mashuensis]
MKRTVIRFALTMTAGICLGIAIGPVGSSQSGARDIANFNEGFEDGARDVREQVARVITNNPDECWIRENVPAIPNSPEWCNG